MLKHFIPLIISITMGNSFAYTQELTHFFASSQSKEHPAGLALFSMDLTNGQITFVKEFDQVASSSYLGISRNGNYLFTIDHFPGKSQGEITSFYIIDGGKELEFISSKEIPGRGPCYVSQSDNGDYLMVANYSQGNAVTFSVSEEGFIGDVVSNVYHHGSSINKERQESPHPHMIIQVPNSSLVLVPDLGTDKIMIYNLSDDGNLSPALQPYLEVPAGSGPRHIAFHPSYQYGFVLNELSNSVTSFKADFEKEEFEKINTVSILPPDFSDFNKSADILVSPNGKFVYATNRGHNSIAILKINEESGAVSLVKTVSCGGDWPRAFRMDPTGKFLLVANKNSGNIVVFAMDDQTGELTPVSENNQFPGPQCIRFLDK